VIATAELQRTSPAIGRGAYCCAAGASGCFTLGRRIDSGASLAVSRSPKSAPPLALDHGMASQAHQILTDGPFHFQVPGDRFNVQHQLDDDPDVSENEYEPIACPACTRIHLINRKPGKLLGKGDESDNDPG
jgi:hypothetical protein